MRRPKILLDPSFRRCAALFSTEQRERLAALGDILWGRDEAVAAEELTCWAEELDAIVTGGWRYGDVARYPRLRAILEVAGSFPSPRLLDYDACFDRRIRVLSCAPGFAPAVAEAALGLAIGAARELVSEDRGFRTGQENWGHRGEVSGFSLWDQPVGFVGCGSIARALRSLLAPFRCRISAYDPWLSPATFRELGITSVDLPTLASESRVLFVLAAPAADNRSLLNRALLERMRQGTLLVLVSRAHVVDFDALTELARDGRISAAIDVFPEEPLPRDHPIRCLPNVVLSPHRAGGGPETYRRIGQMVIDDLEAVLSGRVPAAMQAAQPEFISRLN